MIFLDISFVRLRVSESSSPGEGCSQSGSISCAREGPAGPWGEAQSSEKAGRPRVCRHVENWVPCHGCFVTVELHVALGLLDGLPSSDLI